MTRGRNKVGAGRTALYWRIAAAACVLVLFSVGSFPASGHAFPGTLHWVAHLGTYALISFTVCLGWPHWRPVTVVLLVAAMGAFHEFTEIVTHHHDFETMDAVVNGVGALIGVIVSSCTRYIHTFAMRREDA